MTESSQSQRARLFGMQIDAVTLDQAAQQVLAWSRNDSEEGCRFVVTPNVDHAVMFQRRADLRAAYADAAMVLADGAPLVAVSRMLRRGLPGRVAGSDLAPRLFDLADDARTPLRVFLLGAGPGVADRAAENIHAKWRGVNVCGTYCPPMGFQVDQYQNNLALEAVANASPDVLLIGLGAPKQELWAHRFRPQLGARVALCVGATIDFLAGEKRRSPVWMRRAGLEWTHRLMSEPGRLAKRYAVDALLFPPLVLREWRGLC
ncbi:putative N-acetylmannosaminyltransferase [Posidoniimonas corsicana]|uniref:Putative N-acetylmannosaminyltransferase n=1 Tax=Posidoniimonas corsicana TaxID=1938618 RepID=A0A5C5VCF0_9BACT|nr:WecB/TagA/CpsF family glycosyltransferase [Posidoniimonas corsicana]TWT35700.1 putative N-acetylmannosaminyltransferase [Posidoniimonas corsicana]